MKNILKKFTFLLLLYLISTMSFTTNETSALDFDEHLFSTLHIFGDVEDVNTRVNLLKTDDENIIVLPSAVSPNKVSLYIDTCDISFKRIKGEKKEETFVNGMTIDLEDFCSNKNYLLDFIYDDNNTQFTYTVKFLLTENIPSIYIVSSDPLNNGRAWVESSPDKKNKAIGSMIMQKENGAFIYNGELTQIKGRGNSTWNAVKKPYQIKLKNKVDLLETDDDNNLSSTWVLLTNFEDQSLLRNVTSLNLGKELGLSYNIQCEHVSLYYDGEYRGSYLLSEKVEIGNGRVNIDSLEKRNESENPSIDIESLPIKNSETKNGAIYTYCEGMKSPDNITGGYLLEMDYEERALEEICYFKTTRDQYIVVKSPEYASKEEMEYIATFYQEYEDAVYNNGVNPYTKKTYSEYIDSKSAAIYYLVNEFAKTKDFFSSSAYLYKSSAEDKMYMGPLWDFDSSYGISFAQGSDDVALGLSEYNTDFSIALLSIDDFYRTVQDIYNNEFYRIINDILLAESDKASNELKSIKNQEKYLETAYHNNLKLWGRYSENQHTAEELYNYTKKRLEYMNKLFGADLKRIPDSEMQFLNQTYKDVSEIDWYYLVIEKVTELKYMSGVGNGFFEPQAIVKRSEVAQVIYNLSGEYNDVEYSPVFSDVHQYDWYAKPILWSVDNDIMDGYNDGMFRPDNYATREEVVNYLYRSQKVNTTSVNHLTKFTDYSSVSGFAIDALNWAINEGIIIGDDLNKINPKDFITRAEFAAILARLND